MILKPLLPGNVVQSSPVIVTGNVANFPGRGNGLLFPGELVSVPGLADPLTFLYGRWIEQSTGIVNGASIPLIVDTGTGGNNLTQPTSANQPKWIAADPLFNNQPSVLHGTTSPIGLASVANAANPYTIIFVARILDMSLPSSNRTINSGTFNALISVNRSGFAAYNGTVVKNDTSSNGTTAHIISLAVGTQSHLYIDGVDVTDNTTGITDFGTICTGAAGMQAEVGNCALAAIGLMLEVSDTKRQLVESTWKTKYIP